jgi:hypothetical protein
LDFQAELGNIPFVQELIKKLPLSCAVFMVDPGIYCELGPTGSCGNATTGVNTGDLAFCPASGRLYAFLMPEAGNVLNNIVVESPVVIVGKTLASMAICRRIKPGDKADISVLEEAKHLDKPDPASDSRKLSQVEIDDLVKRLLEEKNKKSG